MHKSKQEILILGALDSHKSFFVKMSQEKNIKIRFIDKMSSSYFWSFVFKIIWSGTLNKYVNVPFKLVLFRKFLQKELSSEVLTKIIFINGKYLQEDIRVLRILPDYPIKSIVWLLNPIEKYDKNFIDNFHLADVVATHESVSLENRKMRFLPLVFEMADDYQASTLRYDLFFIGRPKDRLDMLYNLAVHLNKHSVKIMFILVDVPYGLRKNIPGIIFRKYMPYDEVTSYIAKSKGLLDILQSGEYLPSSRSLEAFKYRKRLLTNIPSVCNQDYFTPGATTIFQSFSDIDCMELKEIVDPKLFLSGEDYSFSTSAWLKRVSEL